MTDLNPEDWARELALHQELFDKLAHHLPRELVETKAGMAQRILGDT